MQGVLIGGLAHGMVREFGDRAMPFTGCYVLLYPLNDVSVNDEGLLVEHPVLLRYMYTGVSLGDIAYYSLP